MFLKKMKERLDVIMLKECSTRDGSGAGTAMTTVTLHDVKEEIKEEASNIFAGVSTSDCKQPPNSMANGEIGKYFIFMLRCVLFNLCVRLLSK